MEELDRNAIPAAASRFNLIEPLLLRHLERRGGRPALLFGSSVISYSDLAQRVAQTREVLLDEGVGRADRVGLLLPDVPSFVYLFLAAVSLGAIVVPINPKQNPHDVRDMLRHVGAKCVFVHEDAFQHLSSIADARLRVRSVDSTLEKLLRSIEPAAQQFVPEATCAAEALYLLFSSGTTGRPKAIIRRHSDIPWTAAAFADDVLHMTAEDRVLAVPKLTFGYALVGNLLFCLLRGATSILIPQTSSAALMLDAIRQFRPSIFLAQPRMLAELLEADANTEHLHCIRTIVSAGDVLSETLRQRWQEKFGQPVLDGFGSTEAGHIFLCNTTAAHPPEAVGHTLRGYETKLIDANSLEVGENVPGRLCIRGGSVSPGYWNDPQRTQAAFRDGWFVSDDVFSRKDGLYYYCGRWDDVIKTGCGEWVLPHRIEALLNRDSAVRDCAVVGAHDERGIVRVKAHVVRVPGPESDLSVAERLKQFAEHEWPELDHMRIHLVEFVPSIPRSPNGKIERHRLAPKTLTDYAYEC
jgi:acyl-coenzyme A synthetase/AMP-(fatty) acid ligase